MKSDIQPSHENCGPVLTSKGLVTRISTRQILVDHVKTEECVV